MFAAVLLLVAAAAALVVAKVLHLYFFGCPKELQGLPAVPTLTFFRYALLGYPQNLSAKLLADSVNGDGFAKLFVIGKWGVVVSHPETVRKILADIDTFPKVEMTKENVSSLMVDTFGQNVVNQNGAAWKAHRRVVAPAFHNFQPYVDVFHKSAFELSAIIKRSVEEQPGLDIGVSELFKNMTIDIISKAGFEHDLKALSGGNTEFLKAYNQFIKCIFRVFDDVASDWGNITAKNKKDPVLLIAPKLERFMTSRNKKLLAAAAVMDKLFYEVIDKRRQELAQWNDNQEKLKDSPDSEAVRPPHDLLALMTQGNLTKEELRSNLLIFFMAGHETTANILSSAMYYLAVHPDVQATARAECDRVMVGKPKNAVATFEEQKQMNYLTGVMKECLRLNGPVLNLNARRVAAPEGVILSGQYLPYKTFIIPSVYGPHHDKRAWGADPTRFDPTRFVETAEHDGDEGFGTSAEKLSGSPIGELQRISWIPFGAGPRACVGINFSLIEQRIVLSHLLRQFSIRLPVNSKHAHGIVNSSAGLLAPDDMRIVFAPLD